MSRTGAAILTHRLRTLMTSDGLRTQLVRGGMGSMAVKAAHAGITFALAIFLARLLGPEGYGIYSFVLALVMMVAVPTQLGVPELIVRETARAHVMAHWSLMRGLWRWGNTFVVLFSLIVLAVVGLGVWLDSGFINSVRQPALVAGLLLVPLIALGNVRGAALRGLRRVVLGLLPEYILRPLLLLIAVSLAVWLWGERNVYPETVMHLHVISALIAFGIGAWLLWRVRPDGVKAKPVPEYQASVWRRAATPLALIAGVHVINGHTDTILLGIFRSDEEVGIYRVAVQLGLLVVFGLQAVNQVLRPHIARLYTQGDLEKLQRLVTFSARIILLLALPPCLVLMTAGDPLLGFLFGEEYRAVAPALAILAFGQLINASMGSVGMLLNMSGHEGDTLRGMAIAAVANIVLNLVLIPPLGVIGAAIGTAMSLFLWNFILRRSVQARLSIESSAILSRMGRHKG